MTMKDPVILLIKMPVCFSINNIIVMHSLGEFYISSVIPKEYIYVITSQKNDNKLSFSEIDSWSKDNRVDNYTINYTSLTDYLRSLSPSE